MSDYPYGKNTILTVRQEILAAAEVQISLSERANRALDIATTRLALILQNYPDVAAEYDRVWRKTPA